MHVVNPFPNSMNHQGISEISFEETYRVPPEQTARALFSRLPHGSDYAQRLIECLATGYLVAIVESICIREMQQHVDADSEVVVGRTIELEHKGPIPPGSTLKLRGWVERLGERSAKFFVQASDDHEVVCEGSVILVVAPRVSLESRIAAKAVALGTKSDVAWLRMFSAGVRRQSRSVARNRRFPERAPPDRSIWAVGAGLPLHPACHTVLAVKVGAHLRCAGGLGGRLRTLTAALRRDPEAAGNPARHSFWSSP